MIDEIKKLLDGYTAWLRDKTALRQVGDWIEITTPYLDRHNDYLQIYAKRENGSFILTDDGYTIQDLLSSGCSLDSKRRQDLLQMTLNGFGVQRAGDALQVRAAPQSFALRKHNLLQAMLAVNDLFYLAKPVVASVFMEDVMAWLELHEVRFTPNVKFTGKSGYDHLFDFVIPKSRTQPERILQAINHPNRDTTLTFIQKWEDTREVRSSESRAYALLNDMESAPPPNIVDALRNYAIHPVWWSARENVIQELAA